MMAREQLTSDLRYLDASHVAHPSGSLAGMVACTDEDESIGTVAGVLVDPASRRVRFYVIERKRLLTSRRYVMPAGEVVVLDASGGKLRMEGVPAALQRFDAKATQPFSDEDLLATLFPSSASKAA